MRLKFKRYGHKGILVQWPAEVHIKLLEEMQAFVLGAKELYNDIDVIYHAYHEVYIEFADIIVDFDICVKRLQSVYQDLKNGSNQKATTWIIPTCYDPKFTPDLDIYLKTKKINLEAFVKEHTSTLYTVSFIGFLPGFLYLGGLSESLSIDRKQVPSKKIIKGTVAIGGMQTGIYPQDSPGGWYGVGYTPISFFDPSNRQQPTWAKPGDQVQFESISPTELEVLEKEIAVGKFTFQTGRHEG